MSDAQDHVDATMERLGMHMPTPDEQAKVDAAAQRHREGKATAFTAYLHELLYQVAVHVSITPHQRLAFVAGGSLYADEVPEGRVMLDVLGLMAEAHATFLARATALHTLGTEWADEPEDVPSPPIYWDKVRNQKGGTHRAALDLLAAAIVVAFNCDQFASAKYLWRDREPTS